LGLPVPFFRKPRVRKVRASQVCRCNLSAVWRAWLRTSPRNPGTEHRSRTAAHGIPMTDDRDQGPERARPSLDESPAPCCLLDSPLRPGPMPGNDRSMGAVTAQNGGERPGSPPSPIQDRRPQINKTDDGPPRSGYTARELPRVACPASNGTVTAGILIKLGRFLGRGLPAERDARRLNSVDLPIRPAPLWKCQRIRTQPCPSLFSTLS
jgi:hypothetical protein